MTSSLCRDIKQQLKREVKSMVNDVGKLIVDTGEVVKVVQDNVHSKVCYPAGDAVDGVKGCVIHRLRSLLYPVSHILFPNYNLPTLIYN